MSPLILVDDSGCVINDGENPFVAGKVGHLSTVSMLRRERDFE